MSRHRYSLRLTWTGNRGTGTSGYRAYDRAHELSAPGRATIDCSSDAAFRGDAARYNPEELLVGSLSSCHMLWFLHLCADSGVVVEHYVDDAEGVMQVDADGGGRFVAVVLKPRCTFRGVVSPDLIRQLHERSHALCFVANSMNFPVRIEPAEPAPGD